MICTWTIRLALSLQLSLLNVYQPWVEIGLKDEGFFLGGETGRCKLQSLLQPAQ